MKSKIIIIGSGAREVAMIRKLQQGLKDLGLDRKMICFTTQNNADIHNHIIHSMPYDYNTESTSLYIKYIEKHHLDIDFVIVGPENPLADGIVDYFETLNVPCIGPYSSYAKLESSKSFCRNFIKMCNLDRYSPKFITISPNDNILKLVPNELELLEKVCHHTDIQYKLKHYLNDVLRKQLGRIVIKKDGLCGGKGVYVENDTDDNTADDNTESVLLNNIVQSYQNKTNLVIEEKLVGQEFSIMTLTDGNGSCFHFPPIQDYKRLKNGNDGPNTGGMGCLVMENGTLPFLNQKDIDTCHTINETIITHLNRSGKKIGLKNGYKGILYGSFMKLDNSQMACDTETINDTETIKIIEYNCRFGDPEGVVALSLLESNLYTICKQIIEGHLDTNIKISHQAALCVYMVPKDYPNVPNVSNEFNTINYDIYMKNNMPKDIELYLSNTAKVGNHLYSQKSRTLCLVTKKDTFYQCYQQIYSHIGKVVGNLEYRSDIGETYLSRYQKSGVSIETATASLQNIKQHILKTYTPKVVSQFGSFGGEFKLDDNNTIVASIDGVGSKSILSTHTYGIEGYKMLGHDIVGHSINDILVQGAYPLFFMDYYGTSSLNSLELENFVAGLSECCIKYGNIPILGGETAEMPLVYQPNQTDLVGCIIGIKNNDFFNNPIHVGDIIISIDSVSPHTNGFTLINELYQQFENNPNKTELQKEKYNHFSKILLQPHKCYLNEVEEFINKYGYDRLKGMCHITGGGFYENMNRVIPKNMSIQLYQKIKLPDWGLFLQEEGNIPYDEMLNVFNCGIGYVLIVDKALFKTTQEGSSKEGLSKLDSSKLDVSYKYTILGEIGRE